MRPGEQHDLKRWQASFKESSQLTITSQEKPLLRDWGLNVRSHWETWRTKMNKSQTLIIGHPVGKNLPTPGLRTSESCLCIKQRNSDDRSQKSPWDWLSHQRHHCGPQILSVFYLRKMCFLCLWQNKWTSIRCINTLLIPGGPSYANGAWLGVFHLPLTRMPWTWGWCLPALRLRVLC